MPKRLNSAPPIMRTGTGFHRNYAVGDLCEKRNQLGACYLLVEDAVASFRCTMNLKCVLCQIYPDYENLLHEHLLLSLVSTSPVWHTYAVRGVSTPSDTYERLPATCKEISCGQKPLHTKEPRLQISMLLDRHQTPTWRPRLVRALLRPSK